MTRPLRASTNTLAAAAGVTGGLAVVAALLLAACGSFTASGDPIADDGGGGPDALAASPDGGDGARGADDAALDVADAGDCIDLTMSAGDFVADSDSPSNVSASDAGLAVDYPASSSAASAQWNYALTPAAALGGATIAIDATIQMPDAPSTRNAGYAAFASLAHGSSMMLGAAPTVVLALGASTATMATLDLDIFPQGIAGNPTPDPAPLSFANVPVGATDVHVVFDVRWSVDASAQNAAAQLGEHGTLHPVMAKTLVTADTAATWTLALGGTAQNNGTMRIVYHRVCIRRH